jgi:hypothetical protein
VIPVNCPPEIAAAIVEILKAGILRIRQLEWANDGERCAIEADHIHNLPDLLTTYSPDLLRHYWDLERTAYMSQTSPADMASFEPLWRRLGPYCDNLADQPLAR